MATPHETLPDRLASTPTGIAPSLFVPLLRLLAEGEPVTIAELAAASAQPQDALREALEAAGEAEYDEEGSIIGLGLTLRPPALEGTPDTMKYPISRRSLSGPRPRRLASALFWRRCRP